MHEYINNDNKSKTLWLKQGEEEEDGLCEIDEMDSLNIISRSLYTYCVTHLWDLWLLPLQNFE